MLTEKLDFKDIQDITDRMLSARRSDLKRVLDIRHRLQSVAHHHGVEFINDSKSTTIQATHYSLSCLQEKVIWLVDGALPDVDMSLLETLVQDKVRCILYIGQDSESHFIEEFVNQVGLIQRCDTMEELVREGAQLAVEGEVVLFSPAAPTGDAYTDYKERGLAFEAQVKQLSN